MQRILIAIYNLDLVKENVFGATKKILFTCTADTPIDVLIVAENIKKAYLEEVDLNTVELTF